MHITLWILQVMLASACLYSGIFKVFLPVKKVFEMGQTGIEGLSPILVNFIGVSELLLAVGLILPWFLNIYPILTPISALLFGVIMIPASVIHYKRFINLNSKKERQNAINNIIILSICVFVAVFRFNQFLNYSF